MPFLSWFMLVRHIRMSYRPLFTKYGNFAPVYPYTRISVYPYIRIPVYPYIRIPVYPYTRIPVYPYIRIPVYPYTRISVYPYIRIPDTRISEYPYIRISVYPYPYTRYPCFLPCQFLVQFLRASNMRAHQNLLNKTNKNFSKLKLPSCLIS